ncbi:PH domain-containing protein [Aerococcus kribbianus]|uniref:PH domain-containing protein n=1 Tax=Aerococcus kribbianus TaxID=2999064 RepID=A0A9X3FQ99_9LACT|nr:MULTISPECIES: PH domain-containing protein [unclassified Aerococcus]MCZ0718115.1 PH domain-containing protein [Aerococcus sp. YH-aer221]MCZ0726316.1 PH domain-containing protein [Aerococcus sp. YH-aer222]
MGLFSGIMGNASQMNLEDAKKELNQILIPNETVELAYKLIRDKVIFTSHRLIIIDIQGVGKKQEYQSIPYRSISRFTVETAGNFDLDSELDIYISAAQEPVAALEFQGKDTIYEVQQALAQAVL